MRWRFAISGTVGSAVSSCGRIAIWFKCANSNRAETACNHFIRSTTEFQCPFQVRSDKGSENCSIPKHAIILSRSEMWGLIGGTSSHDTRIERFRREYDNNAMDHFLGIFNNLEQIGILNCNNNIDL